VLAAKNKKLAMAGLRSRKKQWPAVTRIHWTCGRDWNFSCFNQL
jgi:hypothetical protein